MRFRNEATLSLFICGSSSSYRLRHKQKWVFARTLGRFLHAGSSTAARTFRWGGAGSMVAAFSSLFKSKNKFHYAILLQHKSLWYGKLNYLHSVAQALVLFSWLPCVFCRSTAWGMGENLKSVNSSALWKRLWLFYSETTLVKRSSTVLLWKPSASTFE